MSSRDRHSEPKRRPKHRAHRMKRKQRKAGTS